MSNRCLTSSSNARTMAAWSTSASHATPEADPGVHRIPDPRRAAIRRRSARSASRSGSPHRPPCTATSTRSPGSATCAAIPPSRGRSRSGGTPTRASPWSAARCATCPWSATSPPVPTCSPKRTSRSCFPVPLDFTGEGELFMLRVRGDSMIELGILDGDFVVAVQQATANKGDVVVAGIPGDEATVKTYHPGRRGTVTLLPANPTLAADDVRRRRRHRLRTGRHRDAPALRSPAGERRRSGVAVAATAPVAEGSRARRRRVAPASVRHRRRCPRRPCRGCPATRAGNGGGGGATVAGTSGCCGLTGRCATHRRRRRPRPVVVVARRSPARAVGHRPGVAARRERRPASASNRPPSTTPGGADRHAPRPSCGRRRSTDRGRSPPPSLASEPCTLIS